MRFRNLFAAIDTYFLIAKVSESKLYSFAESSGLASNKESVDAINKEIASLFTAYSDEKQIVGIVKMLSKMMEDLKSIGDRTDDAALDSLYEKKEGIKAILSVVTGLDDIDDEYQEVNSFTNKVKKKKEKVSFKNEAMKISLVAERIYNLGENVIANNNIVNLKEEEKKAQQEEDRLAAEERELLEEQKSAFQSEVDEMAPERAQENYFQSQVEMYKAKREVVKTKFKWIEKEVVRVRRVDEDKKAKRRELENLYNKINPEAVRYRNAHQQRKRALALSSLEEFKSFPLFLEAVKKLILTECPVHKSDSKEFNLAVMPGMGYVYNCYYSYTDNSGIQVTKVHELGSREQYLNLIDSFIDLIKKEEKYEAFLQRSNISEDDPEFLNKVRDKFRHAVAGHIQRNAITKKNREYDRNIVEIRKNLTISNKPAPLQRDYRSNPVAAPESLSSEETSAPVKLTETQKRNARAARARLKEKEELEAKQKAQEPLKDPAVRKQSLQEIIEEQRKRNQN